MFLVVTNQESWGPRFASSRTATPTGPAPSPACGHARADCQTLTKWGETPRAYVELKPGAQASEAELIEYCRANLPRFKAPKTVVFGPLPTTSTGKIQKNILRSRARSTDAID